MAARTSGSDGVSTDGAVVKNLSKFSPFFPPCGKTDGSQQRVNTHVLRPAAPVSSSIKRHLTTAGAERYGSVCGLMGLTFDPGTYSDPLTCTEKQHVAANDDKQLHMGGGEGWTEQRGHSQRHLIRERQRGWKERGRKQHWKEREREGSVETEEQRGNGSVEPGVHLFY